MTSKPGIAGTLAALLLAQGTWASDWVVAYETSSIGFVATYDEIPFEGRFGDFSARIRFDPGTLADASFEVTVNIASVDTDSPDRDEGMLEAEWFDAGRHPQARFSSSRIERLTGENEYAVKGDLTIKDTTRPVAATFLWTQAGPSAHLKGSADVKRGDFGIGSGDWEEDDTIGFDVRILFDLTLTN